MKNDDIISWLLEGDISIQYQVYRDLLNEEKPALQKKIEKEGWGKEILSKRKPHGHWGDRFYQPKWISTHYTLLDLKNLNLDPKNKAVKSSIDQVLDTHIAEDGGIQLGPSTAAHSDVCVNGMFLNYASYFQSKEEKLCSVIDGLLGEKMADGGFNCRTTRSGATHSSLHSTISVLEGFTEYLNNGYQHRKKEVEEAIETAVEFILIHQLFLSDKTGKLIHKDFLKIPFPCRWRYDILRALDYFQCAEIPFDKRMQPALDKLQDMKTKDNRWKLSAKYPGQVHLEMERAGKPSRWNTLRVMRVMKHFDQGKKR